MKIRLCIKSLFLTSLALIGPIVSGETTSFTESTQQRATLSILVVDSQTGQPVRGARVLLDRGRRTNVPLKSASAESGFLTDQAGKLQFESMQPGEYTVLVIKDGYLASPCHVLNLRGGTTSAREVKLDPLAKISGWVVDKNHQRISGARVTALISSMNPSAALVRFVEQYGDGMVTATCDSDGAFELYAPDGNQRLTLIAEARGYASVRTDITELALGRVRSGVVIQLGSGLALRGRVLEEGHGPLNEATIAARRVDVDRSNVEEIRAEVKTHEDGTFSLQGLHPGTYLVRIDHPHCASRILADVKVQADGARIPDIILSPAATITGRVVDMGGQPIPGARISGRTEGEEGAAHALSDFKGQFLLDQLSAGQRVHVWAEANGYASGGEIVEPPESNTILRLRREGTLRGRVEDSETGGPIGDFRIWLDRGSDEKIIHSDDGRFEWQNIPVGRWTVSAQTSGYQLSEVREVEIRSGEKTEGLTFQLKRGVELSGQVLDYDTGERLSGVAVAYGKADESTDISYFRFNKTVQRTDAEGSFKFDGVPPRKVTVVAHSPLYADARATVVAGESAPVELRLSRGASVSGRVLSSDAVTRVPGAQVNLLDETNKSGTTIATDSGGSFSFEHLSAGLYRLTAQTRFGQTASVDVALGENQGVEGLVLCVRTGATLKGRITGLLLNEEKKVDLVARGPDDFTAFGSTDILGQYTILGVPAGSLQLMITTSSFRSISRFVEIPSGLREIEADVDFGQAYHLRGRITMAGKPLPFADLGAIPMSVQLVRGSGRTDEDGTYDIGGLSEGDYTIIVGGLGARSVRILGDTIVDIDWSSRSE